MLVFPENEVINNNTLNQPDASKVQIENLSKKLLIWYFCSEVVK